MADGREKLINFAKHFNSQMYSRTNVSDLTSKLSTTFIQEIPQCNVNNSLDSTTNGQVHNSRYKTLLDRIKRRQMDSTNPSSVVTSNHLNVGQIRSSSYSCNTSDDTVTSSNGEESKVFNGIDTNTCKECLDPVEELATFDDLSKKLSDSTLVESHSDCGKANDLSSVETDFTASSNVDDTKQRRLDKFLKTDHITSNVDTKQHQLSQSSNSIAPSCDVDGLNSQVTVINRTVDIPKLKQQMLKMNMRSDAELDSDDFSSSKESLNDDKSDESKKNDKLDCMSTIPCKSTNDEANVTNKITISMPVFDDSIEVSDEDDWDYYAGPTEDGWGFKFSTT